jgi:hypothetical protein
MRVFTRNYEDTKNGHRDYSDEGTRRDGAGSEKLRSTTWKAQGKEIDMEGTLRPLSPKCLSIIIYQNHAGSNSSIEDLRENFQASIARDLRIQN